MPNNATAPTRMLHTMLRVSNLERSLHFYTSLLGMRLLRRQDYPQGGFTLAFLGYAGDDAATVLELTYNWDGRDYALGSAYGHIALAVADLAGCCASLTQAGVRIVRAPGRMSFAAESGGDSEAFAFIEDPDGYRIELLECS